MTKRTTRPTENTEQRGKRVRRSFVDDTADVLTVQGKDPDYVYRWVNDERGRVQRMIAAGYDVVTDQLEIGSGSDVVSGAVNTITVNPKVGTKGVLMRIRKEYAEEDARERAKVTDRSEAALFRKESNAEGRYGSVQYEE